MKIKKWLMALLIAISIIMLYLVINISINTSTAIKEQYRDKVFELYLWDANLLSLFEIYNADAENREDILIAILQDSGVAESVNNKMGYPYLFPNKGISSYKIPYFQMKQAATKALLNEEELDVEHYIQFLEAKLTYNLHYEALLGINYLSSEEKKIMDKDVNDVKLNYFTHLLFKGNKIMFNSEQRKYLEELFYELNLQKYYGESNVFFN